MDDKKLIEMYKEGLRPLADQLESYQRSKLTKPGKLGEHVRMLRSASQKKYPKMDYAGLVEVMKSVDRTLGKIYAEHPCGPLIILEDDPELTVRNEADRLSRQFVGLGVRDIFYRFDADRYRYTYRHLTSVRDPQAVFLKNLKHVSAELNEPMGDKAFRVMAAELFVAIRELQAAAFRSSDESFYINIVLAYESRTGLTQALNYQKRVEQYQGMVHAMLKHNGVEPKTGPVFSMKLIEYKDWLEYELLNLEELYLCIIYQRILNVL